MHGESVFTHAVRETRIEAVILFFVGFHLSGSLFLSFNLRFIIFNNVNFIYFIYLNPFLKISLNLSCLFSVFIPFFDAVYLGLYNCHNLFICVFSSYICTNLLVFV